MPYGLLTCECPKILAHRFRGSVVTVGVAARGVASTAVRHESQRRADVSTSASCCLSPVQRGRCGRRRIDGSSVSTTCPRCRLTMYACADGVHGHDPLKPATDEVCGGAVVQRQHRRQRGRGRRSRAPRVGDRLHCRSAGSRFPAGMPRQSSGNRRSAHESVTPWSNQQIAPALTPASTMPLRHASRSTSGSPHSRQTASMLFVLPAADVDHVLREQRLRAGPACAGRTAARSASRPGACRRRRTSRSTSAGSALAVGMKQTDGRFFRGQVEDVPVGRQVLGLGPERRPAYRDDVPLRPPSHALYPRAFGLLPLLGRDRPSLVVAPSTGYLQVPRRVAFPAETGAPHQRDRRRVGRLDVRLHAVQLEHAEDEPQHQRHRVAHVALTRVRREHLVARDRRSAILRARSGSG